MYRNHFHLQRAPFSITPDTAFAYSSSSQRNALNTLLLTTDAGEGFVKITGEVGSGKTLLCRRFLARLAAANQPKRRFRTVYIPNPCLSPRTLLMALAAELKVRVANPDSEYDLLDSLNRALLRFAARGEQVVVCLDEAQAMPLETLESLRLLSNLETEQRKLMQIVLFGQRELDARLACDNLRQLRSRIAFQYRLGRLSLPETVGYLQHRLAMAGHSGPPLFSVEAARSIHRGARGLPRRINILAHKALLVAYGQGAPSVSVQHVRLARSDSATDTGAAGLFSWLGRLLAPLRARRLWLASASEQTGS
jgi:MSHA biogenesis protein MshM